MATITTAQSGAWSATTTWVGGVVPVNNDTVTIAAGHHIDFDVDMTAWANGIGTSTFNGELHFPSDGANVQHLKLCGNWDGTGTLMIGNSSTDRFPRTKVAKITFTVDNTIDADKIYIYGEVPEPSISTIAAPAAAGQPQIVLADDMQLRAGDTIAIAVPNSASITCKYTVSSYNASTKTVTLTANLNQARTVGNRVMGVCVAPIQLTKTVALDLNSNYFLYADSDMEISGVYMYNIIGLNYYESDLVIDRCFVEKGMLGQYMEGITVQDCRFYNYPNGLQYSDNCTFRNCVGIVADYFFENCDGGYVYDCEMYHSQGFAGGPSDVGYSQGIIVSNCKTWNSPYACYNHLVKFYDCEFFNDATQSNSVGNAGQSEGCEYRNCRFTGQWKAFASGDWSQFYDCTFENEPSMGWYTSFGAAGLPVWFRGEFKGINGDANGYRSYGPGGTVIRQSTVTYNGQPTTQFSLIKDVPCFKEYKFTIPAHRTYNFRVGVMKDFDGADLVKLQIIDPNSDPLRDPVYGSVISEVSMPNITNEWRELGLSYKSETTKEIIVRLWAKKATGNVYWFTEEINNSLVDDRTSE